MTDSRFCPQCGVPLPADAPQAICPQCLFKMGIASQPSWNSTQQGALFPPGYVAPRPDEIAALFPQLEVLELLGQGGMGIVFKVRQKHLDRIAALKILPPVVARDPAFAERFQREARALARLNHPHIVTVYDFGEMLRGDEGWYYFLMEFVDGVNLRQMVQAGSLEPAQALAIVPQVCEALQFAHDLGIVHRDIKPENLLVDRQGRVKIADFGLAKLINPAAADFRLTGSHQVMGTPLYMAPEQIERTTTVDHRADIYSLGVVFYEMLTGELPLGRFAPPSKKVHVDVRLDDVVLRTLEKEPARRYQQVSQVGTEVVAIGSAKSQAPNRSAQGSKPPIIRRRFIVAAAVVVVFLLLPIAALWFLARVQIAQDQLHAAVDRERASRLLSMASHSLNDMPAPSQASGRSSPIGGGAGSGGEGMGTSSGSVGAGVGGPRYTMSGSMGPSTMPGMGGGRGMAGASGMAGGMAGGMGMGPPGMGMVLGGRPYDGSESLAIAWKEDLPEVSELLQHELHLTPEGVKAVNDALRDVFRNYCAREEERTSAKVGDDGQLIVEILPFETKEINRLENTLWTQIDVILDVPDPAKRNTLRGTARDWIALKDLFPFLKGEKWTVRRTGSWYRWETWEGGGNGGPDVPPPYLRLWKKYSHLLEPKDATDPTTTKPESVESAESVEKPTP